MGDTARIFREFITLALAHPEGPTLARTFDRVLQFDLTDEEPFYMTVQGGQITVAEGDSGLDWKYRDWERVTCVHTSAQVLRDVMAGRRLISEAFFNHDLGFGPRKLADRHHACRRPGRNGDPTGREHQQDGGKPDEAAADRGRNRGKISHDAIPGWQHSVSKRSKTNRGHFK